MARCGHRGLPILALLGSPPGFCILRICTFMELPPLGTGTAGQAGQTEYMGSF